MGWVGVGVSGSLLLDETCRFRLEPEEGQVAIFGEFFMMYSGVVEMCLDGVVGLWVASRRGLHEAVYWELRAEYPGYPSYYISPFFI
jgi:hypothetical protein